MCSGSNKGGDDVYWHVYTHVCRHMATKVATLMQSLHDQHARDEEYSLATIKLALQEANKVPGVPSV